MTKHVKPLSTYLSNIYLGHQFKSYAMRSTLFFNQIFRWILTAAHCTTGKHANYKNKILVIGGHHVNQDGMWYSFETVINHPKYRLYLNDISLIKTNRRVDFTENIKPIRISDRNVQEGSFAMITGWGLDESGQSPQWLNYLHVKVIDNDQCIKSHMPDYAMHIHNTTICTLGERKKGACDGDSGGPLVQDRRLIGVISWGVPCTYFSAFPRYTLDFLFFLKKM